jgi:FixJ family two-component response regulator
MAPKMARARSLIELLAQDEREVLTCLVVGESQQTIAPRLGKDEERALEIRESLMRKLGATCAADAVREGIMAGL